MDETATRPALLRARVAITARSGGELESLSLEINDPQRVLCVIDDLSQRSAPERIVSAVEAKWGKIQVLVNNAGIGMRQPFAEMPVGKLEEILRTNYLGAVYCTHEALPSMLAQHSGHIVNISSGGGIIGTLNMSAYCASKHAVKGFTDAFRLELEHDESTISVTLIKPATINTPYPQHAKNYLPTEPEQPGPVYSPAIVADSPQREEGSSPGA